MLNKNNYIMNLMECETLCEMELTHACFRVVVQDEASATGAVEAAHGVGARVVATAIRLVTLVDRCGKTCQCPIDSHSPAVRQTRELSHKRCQGLLNPNLHLKNKC